MSFLKPVSELKLPYPSVTILPPPSLGCPPMMSEQRLQQSGLFLNNLQHKHENTPNFTSLPPQETSLQRLSAVSKHASDMKFSSQNANNNAQLLLPKPFYKIMKEEPNHASELLLRNRRENHRAVERRRRDNINTGIEELSRIVPGCQRSKGKILHKTAEYIRQLLSRDRHHAQEVKRAQDVYRSHVDHLQQVVRKLLTDQAAASGKPTPSEQDLQQLCHFDVPAIVIANDHDEDLDTCSTSPLSSEHSPSGGYSSSPNNAVEMTTAGHDEAFSLLQLRHGKVSL